MTVGIAEAKELKEVKPEDFKLTDKQDAALEIIKSQALYILLYGGSRSTKTFLLVWIIIWRALGAPKSRHAILRFRFNHVKASIIYDTFPKVMALAFPNCPYKLDKQDWFVRFDNGSEIWFGGLDDKERTEKILGNEYATIFLNECSQISYNSYLTLQTRLAQKCHFIDRDGNKQVLRLKFLLDENPPSKGHWTHKLFIEKREPDSRRSVPCKDDYGSLLMNPIDNKENLSEEYLSILDRLPKRKRDRFYLGLFTDESEGALWTSEIIGRNRVDAVPEDLLQVVIGVDPAGGSENEDADTDKTGIVVIALAEDNNVYVIRDYSKKCLPRAWANIVTNAYLNHKADRIVAEKNNGGLMVRSNIEASENYNDSMHIVLVHASKGKVVRAEPISTLTANGRIKFVGDFPDLEDQLCSMTTLGYMGEGSPDNADAFVWAVSDLLPGINRPSIEEPEFFTIPIKQRM